MKLLFCLLIVLAPITASAQEPNVRLTASVGASSGSFVFPITSFGLSGSFNAGKSVIDLQGRYSFARKQPGGGHNVGALAAVRVPVRRVFLGPAFDMHRQTTSIYDKTEAGIGAQFGTQRRNIILSATFLQDVVSVNKSRSYTGTLEWYGRQRSRVAPYVAASIGVQDLKCHETGHGPVDHCWSNSASISIGFALRRMR